MEEPEKGPGGTGPDETELERIDRNLIELIAALVIATAATGRWAGLDAYWRAKAPVPERTEKALVMESR